MGTDCVFCRKLAALQTVPPDEMVWEFSHSVAFLGTWQYYHGYCLLIARQHATELSGLSTMERRRFLDEMCILAQAIESCFHPRKLNYELLGNQVPHLHWHLFPRYEDDAEKGKPVWVAIDRTEQDANEQLRLQSGPFARSATIEKLRGKLRELAGEV